MTPNLRNELELLVQDVEALAKDRGYEETQDNYRHPFWRADYEAENKCKLSEYVLVIKLYIVLKKCKVQQLYYFWQICRACLQSPHWKQSLWTFRLQIKVKKNRLLWSIT